MNWEIIKYALKMDIRGENSVYLLLFDEFKMLICIDKWIKDFVNDCELCFIETTDDLIFKTQIWNYPSEISTV
jgi:hypothetical protein